MNERGDWSCGALEVGTHRPLFVREERLAGQDGSCRLLYVSDIHLRPARSEALCGQVLDAVTRCAPQAVLLGGDLVDRSSMLDTLRTLVARLRTVTAVLAIGGNHDQWIGLDRVRAAVEAGGGAWIHDGAVAVTSGRRRIVVSGPNATSSVDGDVSVLCAHNPRIWNTARADGYDVVLAGHLHGGQVVAFEYGGCLFPGALLYPHCVLRRQRGGRRLVVSRGVSDLVPVRWRCPREVVLCHV